MSEPVLDVEDLSVRYADGAVTIEALRGVSLRVARGEIVGIVGETGCGKSTLASTLLGVLPRNGRVSAGEIRFEGHSLVELTEDEWRSLRGCRIARISQDPSRSLNPTLSIGRQLIDVLRAHGQSPAKVEMRRRCVQAIQEVGLPTPARQLKRYPHELSGGMRQRVAIAMALLLRPALLVADEPTSALDVTLEAQILDLLRRLRDDHGTAILFVSHHLGVVSHFCESAIVMYAGEVVESGPVADVYARPAHPYTRALLDAIPDPERIGQPLEVIPGRAPSLARPPFGCAFADRCSLVRDTCRVQHPRLYTVGNSVSRCLVHAPDSEYASSSVLEPK